MESTGGVGQYLLWPHHLLRVTPLQQGAVWLQIFLVLRGTQLAFIYANRKWHEGVCSEITSTDVSSGAAPSAPC